MHTHTYKQTHSCGLTSMLPRHIISLGHNARVVDSVEVEQWEVRDVVHQFLARDPTVQVLHGTETQHAPSVRLVEIQHVPGVHEEVHVRGLAEGPVQAAAIAVVAVMDHSSPVPIPQFFR